MLRLNPGLTDDTDQTTRKLQRNVAELVRRIDNVHQGRVGDVFSEEALGLRVRLREYTLKLLHSDPGEFGVTRFFILEYLFIFFCLDCLS